jgi:hypothetical protein
VFSALRMCKDVKLNEETVVWVAVQRAGKAVDEATKDIDANKIIDAKARLQQALYALKRYKLDEKAADGIRLLQDFLARLDSGQYSVRDRKEASYSSSYYRRSSSNKAWTAPSPKPSFSAVPSVQEELDQNPDDSGSKQPKKNPPTHPSKKSK